MYVEQYYCSALLVLFKAKTVSAGLTKADETIALVAAFSIVGVVAAAAVIVLVLYHYEKLPFIDKCRGVQLSPTTRNTIREMEERRIPASVDDHGNLVKFTALPSYDQSEQETSAFSPPPYDATQMIGPMNRPIPAEPPGYAGGRLHRALGRTPYGPMRTDTGNQQPPQYTRPAMSRRNRNAALRPLTESQLRNIAPLERRGQPVDTQSRHSADSIRSHHSTQSRHSDDSIRSYHSTQSRQSADPDHSRSRLRAPLADADDDSLEDTVRVSARRHHLPPQRPQSSQVPRTQPPGHGQEITASPLQPRATLRRATSRQPNARRSNARRSNYRSSQFR